MPDKGVDVVEVFTTTASYIYFDTFEREMREASLNTEFIASNPGEAIDMAVLHADERLKNCMTFMYDQCSLGCIKVGTRVIARFSPDGATQTRFNGHFFEWKCDYPGTRQNWIDKAKAELHVQ